MTITLNVPNTDVAALSAQWVNRVPLLRTVDEDGASTVTGSAAEHVQRAYTEALDTELRAARLVAAAQAVKDATTDEERKTALLAEYKARTGTR